MVAQRRKWFVEINQTGVVHDFCPEASVQQVHNSVLGATDVCVDWQPVSYLIGIKCLTGVVRVCVTQEVPARACKAVHGVGFASSWAATFWTGCVDPFRV